MGFIDNYFASRNGGSQPDDKNQTNQNYLALNKKGLNFLIQECIMNLGIF